MGFFFIMGLTMYCFNSFFESLGNFFKNNIRRVSVSADPQGSDAS